MSRSKIEMYGADWCSDCRRAKRFFEQHKVEYNWIDIETSDAELSSMFSNMPR